MMPSRCRQKWTCSRLPSICVNNTKPTQTFLSKFKQGVPVVTPKPKHASGRQLTTETLKIMTESM